MTDPPLAQFPYHKVVKNICCRTLRNLQGKDALETGALCAYLLDLL